ncbi:MAG: sugar phosphate nucleotidyltransferase, partial [Deltaproteobacteria bacterium]
EIDDEDGEVGGRVLRYKEKPARPTFSWASMTIFCFRPEVLAEVLAINAVEDDSFEFGRDIIPRLLYGRKRIYGYKFHGYWGYTRTLDEYWRTNMDLLGREPKLKLEEWGIRTNLEHRHIRDYQPLKVGSGADIQNSMIYNGCTVEGRVENSILFPGVRIERGAVVRDSVLFFNNIVGRNCRLEKVVSDVNNTIGEGARIGEEGPVAEMEVTVIGWNNFIPKESVIGSDCTIYPELKPEKIAKGVKTGEIVR